MKANGAEKNSHEIIARNVEGGAESAPPGPFRVKAYLCPNINFDGVHFSEEVISFFWRSV